MYATRVENLGCHLNEGKTMHLLTENATVSHSQTLDKAMEVTYDVYTTITYPRTF